MHHIMHTGKRETDLDAGSCRVRLRNGLVVFLPPPIARSQIDATLSSVIVELSCAAVAGGTNVDSTSFRERLVPRVAPFAAAATAAAADAFASAALAAASRCRALYAMRAACSTGFDAPTLCKCSESCSSAALDSVDAAPEAAPLDCALPDLVSSSSGSSCASACFLYAAIIASATMTVGAPAGYTNWLPYVCTVVERERRDTKEMRKWNREVSVMRSYRRQRPPSLA